MATTVALRGWLRRALVYAACGFMIAASRRRAIHGYTVYWTEKEVVDSDIERLVAALDVVDAVDRPAARYLRRYCRGIIVSDALAFSANVRGWSAVLLRSSALRTDSAAMVALILIHEATHLRIDALATIDTAQDVDRAERGCIRAEFDVGAHMDLTPQEREWLDAHGRRVWWKRETGEPLLRAHAHQVRAPAFVTRFLLWLKSPLW